MGSSKKLSDKEILHTLYESPDATAIYTSVDIVIEYANDAMLRFWGKGKEVIGKTIAEGVPELVGQPFIGIMRKVFLTGEDYEARNTEAQLKVDGHLQSFYFDFVYKAVKNEEGKVLSILHTASDVTERYISSRRVSLLNKELSASQQEASIQRQRLYEFFIQAPAGICVLGGEDLVFELINNTYQQLLPQRDLVGRPIFEALPELIGQPVEKVLRRVFETGESETVQELLIPISEYEGGAVVHRYFTFHYVARKNALGKIDGLFVFVYEVTDQVRNRKKLEESEGYFRHLADLVPAKIVNTLPGGEIVYCNKQWLNFSDLSFEELRALGFQKLMHPDEAIVYRTRLGEAAGSGKRMEMETRFRNAQGQYIWHLHAMSPVLGEDGRIRMWVGSSVDIQKHKEEEQRKANFISLLSHELKTPATTIKGYAQLLLKIIEKDQRFPANLRAVLERIDKIVNHLTDVITDMLDLTRIEKDRFELKKTYFSLNDLVEEVVDDFRADKPLQKLQVNHLNFLSVEADREKIGQVLHNLVANAIKYSPEAERIGIKVFAPQTGEVAVRITDFGIGIDKKEFQKIFNRFYTVENMNAPMSGGFGIGLYIAQSIVERHQGQIQVDSEIGKGSSFTVIIPAGE